MKRYRTITLLFPFGFVLLAIFAAFFTIPTAPHSEETAYASLMLTTTPTPTSTPGVPVLSIDVAVTSSHTIVQAGATVWVTATVRNNSSDACLGMPLVTLAVEEEPAQFQDPNDPYLTPGLPQQELRSQMMSPGALLTIPYTLTAAQPGTITFFADISGEGTSYNCDGPYSWTYSSGRSAATTIIAPQNYLPLLLQSESKP